MGLPLLGETLALMKNPYAFMEERGRRHGPVFKSRILGRNVIFVSGPQAAEAFVDAANVTRELAHPSHVRVLFGGINMNMFDGPRHFAMKSMALEAFNQTAIASYLPDMHRLMTAAFARWSGADEISAVDAFKRSAIEIISANILGIEPGAETEALYRNYITVLEGMTSIPIAVPGTKYWRAKAARDRIFVFLRKTISERRQKPGPDGLSRILGARAADGRAFSDDEAMLELHHMFIAGYIVYALFVELILRLGRDEDLRRRVTEEIRTAAPTGPLTIEGLARLPLATRVVFEAKRTAPIVPLAFGKARRSFALGEYQVPEGWDVWWALSLANRDPQIFTSPETFDPQRFADGRAEHKKHRCAYVPQGAEPPTSHRCLGLEYSTFVALTFLTILIRGHTFELPEQDFTYDWKRTPPEPKGGLRLRLVAAAQSR